MILATCRSIQYQYRHSPKGYDFTLVVSLLGLEEQKLLSERSDEFVISGPAGADRQHRQLPYYPLTAACSRKSDAALVNTMDNIVAKEEMTDQVARGQVIIELPSWIAASRVGMVTSLPLTITIASYSSIGEIQAAGIGVEIDEIVGCCNWKG